MLRTEAGRHPYDRALTDLIGELSTRSDTFRNRWAAHNVLLHRSGTKRFHHPVIGDVSFAYEVMELSADTGLTLTAYSPRAAAHPKTLSPSSRAGRPPSMTVSTTSTRHTTDREPSETLRTNVAMEHTAQATG